MSTLGRLLNAALAAVDRRLADDPTQSSWRRSVAELLAFGWRQALACAFAVFIFAMLGLSHRLEVPGLYRYDVLLLACVLFQLAFVRAGLETKEELLVITLFHGLGLALELWKVHLGSWMYPEPAWTKVGGVPLFGGFMYASVGSYVCQAWRRLDLRFHRWPPRWAAGLAGLAVYVNFFTNRHLPDARWWLLFPLVVLVFSRTWVSYAPNGGPRRRMPVLASFLLIGMFIWFAENIATLLGAWRYPNQHTGWKPVYVQKLTSWWLLVIVSIVLVVELKRVHGRRVGVITVNPDDERAVSPAGDVLGPRLEAA